MMTANVTTKCNAIYRIMDDLHTEIKCENTHSLLYLFLKKKEKPVK